MMDHLVQGPPAFQVLVDTTAYGLDGQNWCTVVGIAPGSAAVYPIRVAIPGKGRGQYKISEIMAERQYHTLTVGWR